MTRSSHGGRLSRDYARYAVTRCAVRAGDDDRARSLEGRGGEGRGGRVRNVQRATAEIAPSRSGSTRTDVILREGTWAVI